MWWNPQQKNLTHLPRKHERKGKRHMTYLSFYFGFSSYILGTNIYLQQKFNFSLSNTSYNLNNLKIYSFYTYSLFFFVYLNGFWRDEAKEERNVREKVTSIV